MTSLFPLARRAAALLCLTGALLPGAAPAAERTKPPPDWPLAQIQYQLWAYQVELVGLPMQMPVREFENCVDRERALACSFDDPKSPCKMTMGERVGNTQTSRVDCPDMHGRAEFAWAPDGLSWAGTFQMEGRNMPPGAGMKISAKYLAPCSSAEVRR